MDTLRVCMIGAYDPDYPRHQIIRVGLERLGIQVTGVHIPLRLNTVRKLPYLFREWRQIRDNDVVLIPAFNELLAPFIWAMCRVLRKPALLDYMVGLTDAIIHERDGGTPAQRFLYRQVDRFNLAALPTLTDTQAHLKVFESLWRRDLKKMRVLPVGVYDTWYHEFPEPPPEDPILVQFFGNYIPFHGVEVIIEAAAHFRGNTHVQFELIGHGREYYRACFEKAQAQNLDNLRFVDQVPQPELPARIAGARICLGVFGARPKTAYVVPNKVFQSMAIGRPVITAEAEALREFFTPGEHLLTVPPGEPEALAGAIAKLLASPEERRRIGQAGAARIREAFLPEHIGARLKEILEYVIHPAPRSTRERGAL